MPATGPKGDSRMFRETLTELERLVDIRGKGNLIYEGNAARAMNNGIILMLGLLTEYDVSISELCAIEELERLAEMREKVRVQNLGYYDDTLRFEKVFNEMIDSKIKCIQLGSFSDLDYEGDPEPIVASDRLAALERLAVVKAKIDSRYMDGLLESKIREIDSINSTEMTSCTGTVTTPSHAPQKQGNPEHDLPNTGAESKIPVDSMSKPLSWLEDQYGFHVKDDDDSTVDGGGLTPTSTIVSEWPDPIDE